MKVFVDWVLAQRVRLIIVAVVAAPLLPFVTATLLALETARRGLLQGMVSAAIGIAALLVLVSIPRLDIGMFAMIGVLKFGSGVLVGELVRRVGNLAFAFQAMLLACFLVVGAMVLFGPDTSVLFASQLADLTEMLRASGVTDEEVVLIVEQGERVLLAVVVFLQLAGPLLLGYWCLLLATGQRGFGAEFRRLSLGRLLGAAATAAIVLGLVFDAELVQNFTSLALFGFLFQGLAVMHAWAHAKRWHPGRVAVVYVLLVTPLTTVLVLFTLSVLGLADNWFNLRARFVSPAKRE